MNYRCKTSSVPLGVPGSSASLSGMTNTAVYPVRWCMPQLPPDFGVNEEESHSAGERDVLALIETGVPGRKAGRDPGIRERGICDGALPAGAGDRRGRPLAGVEAPLFSLSVYDNLACFL